MLLTYIFQNTENENILTKLDSTVNIYNSIQYNRKKHTNKSVLWKYNI